MMQTISGFPYFEAQFDKAGALHPENDVEELLRFLQQGTVTDLFVISHGWNNDMAEARKLYRNFFSAVRVELNSGRPPRLDGRTFAVLGILWPSKKFADRELIPSGAAGFGIEPGEEAAIRQELDTLKGAFDHPDADALLEQAKSLVDSAASDPAAAAEFTEILRSLPMTGDAAAEDGSDLFFQRPAAEVVDELSRPEMPVAFGDEGGAAAFDPSAGSDGPVEAAGFNPFGGLLSGLRSVLNFTTYYQMKERAGLVGRTGAYQVVSKIREQQPGLNIHLIGHSFGGRLVTSLANGPEGGRPVLPQSLTLLQAAFSHNGFAKNFNGGKEGFFRKVVSENKVAGPIIISHSVKDTAVGIAYPIASRLSGDNASAFGDKDSLFGGIGRNGAQNTGEGETDNSTPLSGVNFTYRFQKGKLHNLNADNIIFGHSDIAKAEVAHALLCALEGA